MSEKDKKSPSDCGDVRTGPDNIEVGEIVQRDAVFGELTEDGPNYRSVSHANPLCRCTPKPRPDRFFSPQVGWVGTTCLMMKTQIGLGVLSFPSVFETLGMIPGVIILCAVAAITTWSNYIVGVFKLNHGYIYGVDDVGMLLFGRVGKEVLAIAFMGREYLLTPSCSREDQPVC